MDAPGKVPYNHSYNHYNQKGEVYGSHKSSDSRPVKDAKHWAAESKASASMATVDYDPRVMSEPFDDWLKANRPSVLNRDDGIGWIRVFGPDRIMYESEESGPEKDLLGLEASWKHLQKSGEPIDKHTIARIAKMHNVTSGKWMLQVDTGVKVDIAWERIAKAVVSGKLCFFAKISPFDIDSPDHVCCMYNKDYTNEEQVHALEQRIRACGIHSKLMYKPDVYTYIGIHGNTQWNLRLTIYQSLFDALTHQSKVSEKETLVPKMDASGEVPYNHYYQKGEVHGSHKSSDSRPEKDAKHWAAVTKAISSMATVDYDPRVMSEPFDDWLQANRPSVLNRDDGIGWIRVFGPDRIMYESEDSGPEKDVLGLQASWKHLQKSGEPIDKHSITRIAKMHNYTSGYWMLHVETGKVDIAWERIAKAVVSGKLSVRAKVSPLEIDSPNHLCCMYNNDYTNEEQVHALEQRIRACGIQSKLKYKPDVYTLIDIYRNNEWNLLPTIYHSDFDALTHQSKIRYPSLSQFYC